MSFLWMECRFGPACSWGPTTQPQVRWGDATQGAASISVWDYVRFEVSSPGDVNQDGQIDFGDINPFVSALVSGAASGLSPLCAARGRRKRGWA